MYVQPYRNRPSLIQGQSFKCYSLLSFAEVTDEGVRSAMLYIGRLKKFYLKGLKNLTEKPFLHLIRGKVPPQENLILEMLGLLET